MCAVLGGSITYNLLPLWGFFTVFFFLHSPPIRFGSGVYRESPPQEWDFSFILTLSSQRSAQLFFSLKKLHSRFFLALRVSFWESLSPKAASPTTIYKKNRITFHHHEIVFLLFGFLYQKLAQPFDFYLFSAAPPPV